MYDTKTSKKKKRYEICWEAFKMKSTDPPPTRCSHLQGEDEGIKVLQNVGILPQPRTPRIVYVFIYYCIIVPFTVEHSVLAL
jgi:hypothetical protein